MSVHYALHLLEEGARCALFRHQGRNLVSTEAAHVLGEVAREVLRSMDSDLRATRAAGGSGTGWFKIGARYSLTIQLVPQLIVSLRHSTPDLETELTLGSNAELLGKLREGHIDASSQQLNEKGCVIARDKQPVLSVAIPGQRWLSIHGCDLSRWECPAC
ncbi:LysR family transcriptional regulator [Comamonas antarctica]|uniref:LysR family transcriptional regulator n=1 Tax=Comamonas antarctica TaxID=2743470 RepID=UPI001FC8B52A|nr:LysR substrate-binding domain-containing protein [Comamonas antarctica]